MIPTRNPRASRGRLLALALLACAATALVVVASSAAAVPQNTAAPSISGTAKEGSKLTTTNGSWSNSPTSFAYQWRRCAKDGTGCSNIAGAILKSYTLVAGDVGHTVRVVVTATNTDGSTDVSSGATAVVGSKDGPTNTVKPAIQGTAEEGQALSVTHGSWTPTPTSFTQQWQRCDSDGSNCLDISGATGKSYGVLAADVGHRLRALVTAHDTGGQTTAYSNVSSVVVSSTATTTTTVSAAPPRAPKIRILSLHRSGLRIHVVFRVCTAATRVRVTERSLKARSLPKARHFTVHVAGPCKKAARTWVLLRRFRSNGRYVVTLQAKAPSGQVSRLASRSLVLHMS